MQNLRKPAQHPGSFSSIVIVVAGTAAYAFGARWWAATLFPRAFRTATLTPPAFGEAFS